MHTNLHLNTHTKSFTLRSFCSADYKVICQAKYKSSFHLFSRIAYFNMDAVDCFVFVLFHICKKMLRDTDFILNGFLKILKKIKLQKKGNFIYIGFLVGTRIICVWLIMRKRVLVPLKYQIETFVATGDTWVKV